MYFICCLIILSFSLSIGFCFWCLVCRSLCCLCPCMCVCTCECSAQWGQKRALDSQGWSYELPIVGPVQENYGLLTASHISSSHLTFFFIMNHNFHCIFFICGDILKTVFKVRFSPPKWRQCLHIHSHCIILNVCF